MKKFCVTVALLVGVSVVQASDFGIGLVSGLIVGAVAVDATNATHRQREAERQYYESRLYRSHGGQYQVLPPPQYLAPKTCLMQPVFDHYGRFVGYQQVCN